MLSRLIHRSSIAQSARGYATAGPTSGTAPSSNLAPILLGLGLAGAGGFYYSTLNNKGAAQATAKAATASALDPQAFKTFKLEKIVPFNHNTSRFVFSLPEGTDSGLSIASALVVKAAQEGAVKDPKTGKDVIRPYTPTTAPGEVGKLELLVKKYPDGLMTSHIHSLKEGDELAFKGPIPKFHYVPNQFEHIGLIAGGSGITPMWQILQEIAANPADTTKATLIFSNVTEADILLRQEFEALAKQNPHQFKNVFVLDKPPAGWSGESGYISQKVLAQNLPAPAHGEKIKLFVCGPPPQVKAISGPKASMKDQGELKGLLADLGYTEAQVYKF